MTVRAILSNRAQDIITVSPDARVGDAVDLLSQKRIGALPVTDDTGVVGIFSERDVIRCLRQAGLAALETRVGDVMTTPALIVDADTPIVAALSLMTRRRIRHLPVIEAGRMIGFVSIGDLVKYRIDRIESEAAALRDYIAG